MEVIWTPGNLKLEGLLFRFGNVVENMLLLSGRCIGGGVVTKKQLSSVSIYCSITV
jgi:hypothetical protein